LRNGKREREREREKDHRKQFRAWMLFRTRAMLTSLTVYSWFFKFCEYTNMCPSTKT
jgi:hypothetical protein